MVEVCLKLWLFPLINSSFPTSSCSKDTLYFFLHYQYLEVLEPPLRAPIDAWGYFPMLWYTTRIFPTKAHSNRSNNVTAFQVFQIHHWLRSLPYQYFCSLQPSSTADHSGQLKMYVLSCVCPARVKVGFKACKWNLAVALHLKHS